MGRINLTRIYTRLGDDGETHLGDMSRVPKTDPRIQAFGTVDELNAQVGVLRSLDVKLPEPVEALLGRVQNELFDVGADLCVPAESREGRLTVTAEQTQGLEKACDEYNADLAPLTSFVIPGGTKAAAQLHVCRTVCRRAEREALLVEDANPEVVRYLNRLSDLLFILSRYVNAGNDVLWQPGESRSGDGDDS